MSTITLKIDCGYIKKPDLDIIEEVTQQCLEKLSEEYTVFDVELTEQNYFDAGHFTLQMIENLNMDINQNTDKKQERPVLKLVKQ